MEAIFKPMAKISRGDVVIARINHDGFVKVRPVVVVQNDRNNARLTNVIVAMITSNTRLVGNEPTQVLIDLATSSGKQSGLAQTSVVKCENLYTISSQRLRNIGSLSSALMQQVDAALKASLQLK
jgi:mRNA interferase MazF